MSDPAPSIVARRDSGPKVHILLCTYNGAAWLEAQLESLVAQTHRDWLLWVSDDNSSDDTRAILARFAARYPGRVAAVLDGPRKGGAANFLSLLCHADIPEGYVALCDQDDVWMPHKLAHALAQLRPWAGTPCAWAGRYMFTDQYLNPLGLSPHWARGPSLENALVQNIMSGHTLTLNPEALALVRRAGPMPVAHHDWWIYLLLMACNGHALIDTEVVLQYRQHRDNTIGRRAGLRARAGRAIAMVNGTLNSWIMGNLAALAAADAPLSPQARHLVDGSRQRSAKIASAALGNFSTHRQHRAETLAFAFAKCLRRL
ncbi:glycosyltransferase [Roseinatronobacter bogoriensis]|uniref:Glycosyl transferase n=1 Tax=Roseinatronobacter bogoriensis subsp. barguzinensis TaxID=441209 RepID=A0A2K8KHH1_9RHOB|nr:MULTISPECIES: glycosyltransferase [Rhodobaca]ATX65600.1 glycosyl transferase [Rhodobaca barguzinensis]MBB4208467.1 glycosyltransferase involved in cell wall biosynthesis [Rhodobaca bogoriensis DSM 18756]